MREAVRLQTRGKRIRTMAIRLIDRNEKVCYKGSVYELVIWWNRENLRRCFCGMHPGLAYIRKDGENFADINCYSNDNSHFTVEAFHLAMEHVEWRVCFSGRDINTIPFTELLGRLPL